jgi:hypothetical protein
MFMQRRKSYKMKKCNVCGETKELALMCKEKTYPDGVRPLCMECRKAKQAAYRARDKGVAPKVEGVTAAPTKEFKPWVVDDSRNYYYRNDGLKHIKSRGV